MVDLRGRGRRPVPSRHERQRRDERTRDRPEFPGARLGRPGARPAQFPGPRGRQEE